MTLPIQAGLFHERESGNFSCCEPVKIWISWVGEDTKSLWRQRVRIVKIWIRRARETIQDLRGAKGARHDRHQLNLQIRQNQGSQKVAKKSENSGKSHKRFRIDCLLCQTEDWAHKNATILKKANNVGTLPHPVPQNDFLCLRNPTKWGNLDHICIVIYFPEVGFPSWWQDGNHDALGGEKCLLLRNPECNLMKGLDF